ncbi:SnoaL-like domain-containing protein [Salinimicrobium catena]|uniref:SnoaL-like domain-containing protein n=1 Tax=Salinimicrobium catena TaxID=390640 RepID=A0A1H5HS62_9FLAO|nr:nuclear transport factor 2 family protein [Salinimicrobium catena]SDK72305.1 SnoaL-like domain-containing protein [Salinimicrobium catena]SEE30827.1 SnoaL-like domain-containing protein [Salinimicrobium catena]
MKNLLFFCLSVVLFTGFTGHAQAPKENINKMLEAWHDAAARADYDAYFSKMADESIFIGTDPTENWEKDEFAKWSKPYFDKGKAWSFSTLERNIFLQEDCDIAWFDELLETQMGICRGSGVVAKEDGEWKVKHYVLSIEIPNENVDQITEIKKDFDQKLISKIKSE